MAYSYYGSHDNLIAGSAPLRGAHVLPDRGRPARSSSWAGRTPAVPDRDERHGVARSRQWEL